MGNGFFATSANASVLTELGAAAPTNPYATPYMIRLKPEDFDRPDTIAWLPEAGHLAPAEFTRRFGPLVGR